MKKFKNITYSELKKLRREQFLKQGEICPILKQKIKYEESVFDHKHKKKSELPGEDGGCLRGVIHNLANIMEGKVTRTYKRYGLHKLIPLPELLINLSEYLISPPMSPEYIHPKERVFEKIGKREYNELKKKFFEKYPNRTVFPAYPRKGKLTKKIKSISESLKNNV